MTKTIFTVAADLRAKAIEKREAELEAERKLQLEKDFALMEQYLKRFGHLGDMLHDSGLSFAADARDKCIIFRKEEVEVRMDFKGAAEWRPEYVPRNSDYSCRYMFGDYTDEDFILYIAGEFEVFGLYA